MIRQSNFCSTDRENANERGDRRREGAREQHSGALPPSCVRERTVIVHVLHASVLAVGGREGGGIVLQGIAASYSLATLARIG